MKNIFKHMAWVLIAGLAMTACSPEDFTGANGNLPQASDYADNFKVIVDQSTNYANFEFTSAPGVTPVWIIDGASYSSAFSLSKYYRKKGSYTVECKVKNANGISDGTVVKTFVVEKTKMTGFGGFVEDSNYNFFKGLELPNNPGNNDNPAHNPAFWYAPGWNMIDAPRCVLSKGAYTITLPEATTDQWQAQMAINTGLSISADKHYDFSVIVTSSTAHKNVKVKICQADNDNIILMDKNFALDAGEPKALWGSDLEIYSADPEKIPVTDFSNVKVVFDFGGNAENTEVSIESFVLKDHANDDGTEVPDDTPEPTWVAIDSEDNIWNSATFTNSFYYANEDWSGRPNPEMTVDGRAYTFIFPLATALQWQNQVLFNTDLTADTETTYDFCVTLVANKAIGGVTVKLVQTDEVDENGEPVKHDNNYFFAEQIKLEADTDYKFWVSEKKAPEAMHAISLVLDFGGNPDDTKVTVKDIIFQKH